MSLLFNKPLVLAPLGVVAALVAFAGSGEAQSLDREARFRSLTAHTSRLDPSQEPGPGTLADAAWLEGAWEGQGLGGRIQELWSAPAADRMTGAFTSLAADGARFHELMALVEKDGTLELWVKHFDPDFTAWEEKDEKAVFRLVEVSPGVLRFDGLTMERLGTDGYRAYLAMGQGEGLREEVFEMRRVR